MRSFQACLKNELYLMLYRKKTVAFLIFSAVLPIILTFFLHSLQPFLGLIAINRSFPIDMLSLYTMLLIPLFIFLTASDLFPNEISSRTLKLSLLRPNTRLQVFLAKTAALVIGIGAILLILGAVTTVCSLFIGEAGSFDGPGMLKTYFASFISMIALSALFVFVSQFFSTASGSFAFSIILYAAAKLAPFFFHSILPFSPASYTDWYLLWLSNSVTAAKLFTTALFLVSSCTLFFSIGYIMFSRKEV